MKDRLEFRGTWIDLFGTILAVTFLTLLTCGIYAPWGYVQMRRTVLTKIYQRDRPFQFDGAGGQLFGEMLWILLFSLITGGLYALLGFAQLRILRWEASHTILPDGRRLEYRGSAMGLFGENLLIGLFTTLTLGIYIFWGYARYRRYVFNNMYIHGYGESFSFTGSGNQYLGITLVNFILSTITFGIYALLGFASVRVLKWDAENTYVPNSMVVQAPLANGFNASGINVTVNVTR